MAEKKYKDPDVFEEEYVRKNRTFPRTNAILLALCIIMQAVLIILAIFYNPKPQDVINEYNITVSPCDDGSLDIRYSFVWTALDTGEELTWVDIGMAHSDFTIDRESLSDTMASGIGARDKRVVDLFRMKKCEVGMSGGVSLLGSVAAVLGAFLMMLLGYAFVGGAYLPYILGGIAAFAGCIFDSMLGSLFQVKYRCVSCGALVEKEEHCGVSAERVRGVVFFDNSTVNFFSSFFAAVLAIVLVFIF